MFRAAPRLIARSAHLRSVTPARRYISTAPPAQKSRSWKSLAARIGIAGTIIYYYNTTDAFAEEPIQRVQDLPETETESEHLPTIESISAERQKRKAVQAQLDAQAQKEAESPQRGASRADGAEGGIGGLEAEADQQGAFNPETGEINWDCPCLGGMATGPCGDQFKAAFSCFVFSEEEPKGMDCIDKFKDMQNCFREYPEVYGSELEGDDEDNEEDLSMDAEATPPPQSATAAETSSSKPAPQPESNTAEQGKLSGEPSWQPQSAEKVADGRPGLALVPNSYKPDDAPDNKAATQTKSNEPVSESERLVPKAAHDAADEPTKRQEKK